MNDVQTFWSRQDHDIYETLNKARAGIEQACKEGHELAKIVVDTCNRAGLYEKDIMTILAFNLLTKYDEHMNIIEQQNVALQSIGGSLPARTIVQVLRYPSDDPQVKLQVLCSDGTVWMHSGYGWGCVTDAKLPQP